MKKNKRWNFTQTVQKICKCEYLFAAVPADGSSELNASPQLVPLLEEAGELLPPRLAQCPWKNLILTLLLILLHGVGKIPRDGAHEPHSDMRQDMRNRLFFPLWDLQCNEEILHSVFSNCEAGPFEVHKCHCYKVLMGRKEEVQ